MAGELMTLETTQYLALRPNSEAMEAIQANIGDGEDIGEANLTRVPTPAGGALSWQVDEVDGQKTYREIKGVLVYFGKGGVLWPSTDPKPGTLPYLRTDDCRVAYRMGEDSGDLDLDKIEQHSRGDGTYDWKWLADGPNAPFGFGTGKSGHGKRAQEYRTLCILREGDVFPLLVRAKPGSLKNVNQFISRLTAAGIPYFRAVVSLGLEKAQNGAGQPFSKIVPSLVARLDKAAGERVCQLYAEPLKAAVRKFDLSPDELGDDGE